MSACVSDFGTRPDHLEDEGVDVAMFNNNDIKKLNWLNLSMKFFRPQNFFSALEVPKIGSIFTTNFWER